MPRLKQQGFFALEYLLSFPIALILLALACYLFTYCNKTLQLMQNYYFLHENCRLVHHQLRHALKGKTNGYFVERENGFCSQEQPICFYIQKTIRKNKNGEFIWALYQKNGTEQAQEIIEHVEKIKIIYGRANQDGAFVQENVLHPQQNLIKILHIYLLLTSNDEILQHVMSYRFLDQTIVAEDKRLYQPLHIVIQVA